MVAGWCGHLLGGERMGYLKVGDMVGITMHLWHRDGDYLGEEWRAAKKVRS